jgi:hypothetical protein
LVTSGHLAHLYILDLEGLIEMQRGRRRSHNKAPAAIDA